MLIELLDHNGTLIESRCVAVSQIAATVTDLMRSFQEGDLITIEE